MLYSLIELQEIILVQKKSGTVLVVGGHGFFARVRSALGDAVGRALSVLAALAVGIWIFFSILPGVVFALVLTVIIGLSVWGIAAAARRSEADGRASLSRRALTIAAGTLLIVFLLWRWSYISPL